MLGKLFHKFGEKTAERDLREYLNVVNNSTNKMLVATLAHAALMYYQLIMNYGSNLTLAITSSSKSDFEVKSDYSRMLSKIIIETNRGISEFHKSGNMGDAAGLKLLNVTFRCMIHPELFHIGKSIWDRIEPINLEAKQVLETKRDDLRDKNYNTEKIDFAIDAIESLRPLVLS